MQPKAPGRRFASGFESGNVFHVSVEVGQVYQRGSAIVLVLKKRTTIPNDWVSAIDQDLSRLVWWDVLILSDSDYDELYKSGSVTS